VSPRDCNERRGVPPVEWSADRNIAGQAKILGYRWSSPVVWGEKVFVTTAVTDKRAKPAGGSGGIMVGKLLDEVYSGGH
jgi:acyl dehydratase